MAGSGESCDYYRTSYHLKSKTLKYKKTFNTL